jgi:hypothetical protein
MLEQMKKNFISKLEKKMTCNCTKEIVTTSSCCEPSNSDCCMPSESSCCDTSDTKCCSEKNCC